MGCEAMKKKPAPELVELDALLAAGAPPGTPPLRPNASRMDGVAHALQPYLGDIFRLARNGMTVGQIAGWLGYGAAVLEDYAARFPDVHHALVSGRLHGVDLATDKLMSLVQMGDMQAIKLYLERRGGWAAPAKAAGPSTLVQVNTGDAAAVISASNVDRLAADHADLLDRVAAGDIAPVLPVTAAPALPAPAVADLEGFAFEAEAGRA